MPDPGTLVHLVARHPALRRLAPPGRRRVPFVPQVQAADCGAACLAMALRLHGRHVQVEEIARALAAGRDGVSARALLDAARHFGLRARAVRLEPGDLGALPAGSVLHWDMSHFVVLDRVRGKRVEIVDPSLGRRTVGPDELGRSFTGVAVTLEPAEGFRGCRDGRDGRGGRTGPSLLHEYARRVLAHRRALARVVLTSVLVQLFALALPVLTGTVVDRVVPRADRELLGVLAIGLVVVVLFQGLASAVRSLLLLELRTRLDVQLSVEFLEHLLKLPFPFFQNRETGDLILRLNSNRVIRETLTSGVLSGVLDGTLVAAYLVILLMMHAGFGSLVVALGALRVGIFLVLRNRVRDLEAESLRAQARAASYEVQMLEGVEGVKTSGAEDVVTGRWTDLFVDVLNVTLRQGRLSAVVDSALHALATGSPLLLLGFGAHLVIEGRLSLGTMLALNALAAGFLGPLSSLVSMLLRLQTLRSTVERVADVLQADPEQHGVEVRPAPRLRGELAVEKVTFRFPGAAAPALRDVSFVVPAGGRIALVGPSGSGKSTLARVLLGVLQPEAGRVLADGHDIAGLEAASYRRQTGFVPQHPFLFHRSIRVNVALARPDASPAEIARALRTAALDADVAALPLGCDTPLAAGNGSVSGGQAQRIAIARAVLHRPVLLVLDEATSQLDTVTEHEIQRRLRALEATQVLIAHRLSTVRDVDRILVLDQGCIVQSGTHEELAARPGLYSELAAGQMAAQAGR